MLISYVFKIYPIFMNQLLFEERSANHELFNNNKNKLYDVLSNVKLPGMQYGWRFPMFAPHLSETDFVPFARETIKTSGLLLFLKINIGKDLTNKNN